MKRIVVPFVSLLLAMMLATVASAQGLQPGTGNVNFTVMNMSETATAHVRADYVNQSGVVEKYVEKDIDPLSSDGFPITDSGLPDNWLGSVIVSADQEIVAFAQARWELGTYGDGKTAGAYNGFTAGSDKLYFPSLSARAGKQVSSISVQSAEGPSESETIPISIKYYDRDGTLNKEVTDTLLKGTQKTYDLMDAGLTANRPDGWLGAAVVTATGGDPIAGAATMHWQEYTGAYSAVTGGGTTANLPSATRRIDSGGDWLQYTAVIVQNLDESTDASVTVDWYDRLGTKLFTFNDTVPANSSHGYNTRQTGSDVPDHTALHNALGTNWNGSVVVTSNNSVDIVAVANLQWTDESPVGLAATSYSSEVSGYAETFIPATFRRLSGATWKQFTGLIVQNVGTAACNNFDVEWRDRAGNMLLSYEDSLSPNISHGYNTKNPADMPSSGWSNIDDLGSDFRGSVYINAPGCELIAIHNTLWPFWTDSTTYNAFGK